MENWKKSGREFLQANWQLLEGFKSDQQLKLPPPELQLTCPDGAKLIDLPPTAELKFGDLPLIEAINRRESRRTYDTGQSLSLEELAFLLWTTQGVRQVAPSGKAALRTVPSGGARHTFETYLAIRRVAGLEPGIYRYRPLDHQLAHLRTLADFDSAVSASCFNQKCTVQAAVVFVWSSIPARAEWRYGPVSHKMIAIDVGHVCQNLYLACEAINCGTVAIGAYDQQKIDELVGVDGEDELVVYAAALGKLNQLIDS